MISEGDRVYHVEYPDHLGTVIGTRQAEGRECAVVHWDDSCPWPDGSPVHLVHVARYLRKVP